MAAAVKLSSRALVSVRSVREEQPAAAVLVRASYDMTQLDWGTSFGVEHVESAEEHVLLVHRCFYHDFFSAHAGSSLLTSRIFCRADQLFFEKASGFNLDDLKKNNVFQVHGTLASGQPACRFTINKRAVGLGGQ